MTDEPKATGTNDTMPAPTEAGESHQQLKDLLMVYGKPAIVAVLAFLIGIGGTNWFRQHRARKAAEASARLTSAQSVTDLEALAADVRSGPLAPIARLKLAKAYFDAGSYDLAVARYEEFERDYPRHEFLPATALGKAFCFEARGQWQDAAQRFADFISAQPKHYLTPQAILGQARCLHHLGKPADAKALVEDFLAANPKHAWASVAEETLETLDRPPFDPASRPVALPADSFPAFDAGGVFAPPAATPPQIPSASATPDVTLPADTPPAQPPADDNPEKPAVPTPPETPPRTDSAGDMNVIPPQ